jgi:PleD family two-component response regulator
MLISSDTREKTRELVADAILYTPVRAGTLSETLSQLIGRPPAHLKGANHSADGAELGAQPRLPALRVLVADDNLINQKLACALLKKMGCVADTADDGLAALEKVRTNNYDLVLMIA